MVLFQNARAAWGSLESGSTFAARLTILSSYARPDSTSAPSYDFSSLSPTAKETSEATEYICPREAVKQFVNAELLTNYCSTKMRLL